VFAADAGIGPLLDALRSDEAETAWVAFLTAYSDVIYGVVRTIARNSDHAGDCYLFVCTKLADKNYRRLLAFRCDGRARFSTWLRAVVRNLCLDWHRSEFGRNQAFASVNSLSLIDHEIFRLVFQGGMPVLEAWETLHQADRSITYNCVDECAAKLRRLMTARQLWLLSTANTPVESLDANNEESRALEVADPTPSPEMLSLLNETFVQVAKALKELDPGDCLLLRLRFQEGLGLLDIAKLVGLKDAQTADRRIRDAVDKLREKLGIPRPVRGKPKSASV
jgi:RNA polymerase sigma factor (sigma-70 family)